MNDRTCGAPLQRRPEVPSTAYVKCPLPLETGGNRELRPVSNCIGCEHFRGLIERPGEWRTDFDRRFRVSCGFPLARAISTVRSD